MIVIGTVDTFSRLPLDHNKANFAIYNLSSMREGFGKKLRILPNVQISVSTRDIEFDTWYANYIISTDTIFIEFFEMILNLYNGLNVYIAISQGDIYETLAESITKLIQVRYGYNSQFINEPEDINIDDASQFSVEGIQVFSQDKERYINILTQYGIPVRNDIII